MRLWGRLWPVLAFTSLMFVIIWAFLFVVPYEFKLEKKYDVLVDVLTIVLAIAGVAITAFGYGVYRILSRNIEERAEDIMRSEQAEHQVERLQLVRVICVERWKEWSLLPSAEKETKLYLLDMAIHVSREAISKAREKLVSEEARKKRSEREQREDEMLVLQLENDLAYYLAERREPEDTHEAEEIARKLYSKAMSQVIPDDHWLDTCAYVFKRLPLTAEDPARGDQIVDQLLARRDITKERLRELGAKYGRELRL